jgi:hypothetical protein
MPFHMEIVADKLEKAAFHQCSIFIHSSPTLEILANEDVVKKHISNNSNLNNF